MLFNLLLSVLFFVSSICWTDPPVIVTKTSVDGGTWNQWRGPDRNGISPARGLLKKWPETGPKTIWTVDSVGTGYSSIILSENRIYTQGDLKGVEHTICLDAKDGQVIWAVQPEPAKQRLTERVTKEIKTMDVNQNGILEEVEVLGRMRFRDLNQADRESGDNAEQLAKQRTQRIFDALDKNRDGKLTFTEANIFREEFLQIDRASDNIEVNVLAKKRTDLAFDTIDADKDERISRDEARNTDLNQKFNRIDLRDKDDPKNKDRKIGDNLLNRKELEAYFEKHEAGLDGMVTPAELNAFYVKRCANRDGILTPEELRSHVGGYRNGMGDGPRGTPTIDGNRLYTLGGNGDFTCLDVADGKTIWHVNLVSDFGGRVPGWGYSESPLVEGNMVIITPGGQQGTLLALDKTTGEKIWQSTETTQAAHYSSPIVADIGGIHQIVQFARESCFGVKADNGKLLWEYKNANNGTANCSTPIVSEDHVFVSSAYGTGGGLAKIKTSGQKQSATEVYFEKSMGDHHGGTVKVGNYLYSMGAGRLICMHFLTGKIAWQDRSVGKGSLVVADGMLYLLGERHQVGLAEATPEGYRETGKFKLESQGRPSWAHPVVVGGRLYIRDQRKLTAYDLKK